MRNIISEKLYNLKKKYIFDRTIECYIYCVTEVIIQDELILIALFKFYYIYMYTRIYLFKSINAEVNIND